MVTLRLVSTFCFIILLQHTSILSLGLCADVVFSHEDEDGTPLPKSIIQRLLESSMVKKWNAILCSIISEEEMNHSSQQNIRCYFITRNLRQAHTYRCSFLRHHPSSRLATRIQGETTLAKTSRKQKGYRINTQNLGLRKKKSKETALLNHAIFKL